MLSDSNLRGGERASDWYKVCHATRNDVGKGKAFSFVRSSLDDGDCKDIYGNRTVTKATKRRRRARSMEDGSDERGEKADRKSGFNALCVVYPRQPGLGFSSVVIAITRVNFARLS